ncbi:hypothetical protein JCM10450v2_006652 [Rhodotorula kratochvilovae]
MLVRTPRAACGLALASLLFVVPPVSTQSAAEGTLDAGPTGQGDCTASGSGSFLCSNGAYCTWHIAFSAFSCEGALHGQAETEGGSTFGARAEAKEADYSDQCDSVDLGAYDLVLHIIALFLVLISSLIGVLLPLFCSSMMRRSAFANAFFAAKHFGTGVIISTAFVHLLYHSFIMFANPCLGELAFEPAAAAIAMAGTYVIFAVDFFVMRWLKSRGENRAAATATVHLDDPTPSPPSSQPEKQLDGGRGEGPDGHGYTDYSSPQAHFDVTILEAGMIFHSIMIGVSLGASGGSQWTPIFIAVVFHQLFEGLALGSRIGQLIWTRKNQWWRKWVMAGAFGLITPIGVAIGIGVHSAYNPNSSAAILSIGVLDSISAGILLYAGLVELLAHDFMQGELAHARWPRVATAFFFLLAGSLCMSVLGKWT